MTAKQTASYRSKRDDVVGVAVADTHVFITANLQKLRSGGFSPEHLYAVGMLADALRRAPNGTRLEVFVKAGDRGIVEGADFDGGAGLVVCASKRAGFLDVRMPHQFHTPDALCAKDVQPFDDRSDVLFGRYTEFCGISGPVDLPGEKEPFTECQRKYFSELASEHPDVMDVGATSGPRAKASVPMKNWDGFKYVIVTEGWTNPGKLAKALALGAVVLLPTTPWKQYFDGAIEARRHFYPVWTKHKDDVLDALKWLKSHPSQARAIADEGRRFACEGLVMRERMAWWDELVHSSAENVFVDADGLAELYQRVDEGFAVEIQPGMYECTCANDEQEEKVEDNCSAAGKCFFHV